jgi:dihydropteroate synthase
MRDELTFRARDKKLELGSKTRLMGVVNITPDSFSDGGRFLDPDRAADHCFALVKSGADILDLGGESSRPGAQPVSVHEEEDRVLPVLERVRNGTSVLISVDTYKASVAEEALRLGADVVNDISSFRLDPRVAEVVAEWNAGVVLMHMRGSPSKMHLLPPSTDILKEVHDDLQVAVNKAYNSNIARDRIILDPGIGFGKNTAENLQIFSRLSFLRDFELPILVGPSRKRFIGRLLGLPSGERLMGTAASCAVSIWSGAHLLRVHDVKEMKQVAMIVDAIDAERVQE